MNDVRAAIEGGVLPGRVWLYSNYQCNLECAYCLTESAPRSTRRILEADRMVELAGQAAALGFTEIGVTGGEPFLRRELPDILVRIAEILPTTVLSNGTQFAAHRIEHVRPLVGRPISVQISLDSPDPDLNDRFRAPDNFATVVATIPRLVDMGVHVRLATTLEPGSLSAEDHRRLCDLHRAWGISDDDHIVRPVIRRGRADTSEMGEQFERDQLPPELTIAAHGAFWSAFGPTVRDGRADTRLLLTRTIDPLAVPAEALLRLVAGRPPGADAQIGIR